MSLNSNQRAQWSGVDATILKQRHDFLRPDSLVAIIDMTDENDSEIDVRALGGQGYLWMAQNFDPPRGTSQCAENATASGLTDPTCSSSVPESCCNSCQFASNAGSDPTCALGTFQARNDWGYNPNLRHVHMTQKYGLWPQFPIQRYVVGLTSQTVPDRSGEYPSGAESYQGLANRDCTNPLFAASLPDGTATDAATLCNLPPGARSPNLIYYAHIGGLPHQLLQQDPTNPDSPPKETLTPADWIAILGADPQNQNYTGIDPHMIGNVPCLVLVQLTGQVGPGACANPGSACVNAQGLFGPGDVPTGATGPIVTTDILSTFCAAQEATYKGVPGAAGDPDTYPTCALQELTTGLNPGDFHNGSCSEAMTDQGWCYVEGAAANGCSQAILFTHREPPEGAIVSLQCIEQAVTVLGDGGGE